MYVITPCLIGPLIMLTIALICNNLDPNRQYPTLWDISPFTFQCLCGVKNKEEEQMTSVTVAESEAERRPSITGVIHEEDVL